MDDNDDVWEKTDKAPTVGGGVVEPPDCCEGLFQYVLDYLKKFFFFFNRGTSVGEGFLWKLNEENHAF